MKKYNLNNEANILRIQKHQLDKIENKISEVSSILSSISNEQEDNQHLLDNMIYDMENSLNVEYDVYQKFNESLIAKYGKPEPKNRWDNNFEHKLHPMANEEESRKYASMVSIVFYEMVETDIDTQSLREKKLNTILG